MQAKKPPEPNRQLSAPPSRQLAGASAEALAEAFLSRQGLRILERNWRVRGGEIDLICEDHGSLVFVEVRLRRRNDFGGAGASITPAKQRRLILAARHYLAGKRERPCRFDAVLLDGLTEANIDWIRNAFEAY
ncbi:MAG: YraN family protein [Proteobacteria bacterium]|nr:YraN family protein [Pseudomonadota bacterium]